MPEQKVKITWPVPDAVIERLKKDFDVAVFEPKRPLNGGELTAFCADADAVITMVVNKIDRTFMDACKQLKIIANYAVGFDNIDVPAATKRGIIVTNTPGVLTETTADLAWALIMSTCRRVIEGDQMCRSGKFKGWHSLMLLGGDIHGKTLGIYGFGRIGQAVARRASGFNMKVIYHDERRADEATEKALGARFVGFDEMLAQADILSIHVPLNQSTIHKFSLPEFEKMKKTSYLINSARGAVIDEASLAYALKQKIIAGAGLDVYEAEPDITRELRKLNNVVLLPHLGSATVETRTAMGMLAADNVIAALTGGTPPTCLNPEVLKPR